MICTMRAEDACKLVPTSRYLDVAQLSSADDPPINPGSWPKFTNCLGLKSL